VFYDCDIEPDGNHAGSGGAVQADLADLLMEDSMVLASDARGTVGTGGGVALVRETSAVINRTTFARNSAERWGGALFASGAALQVADSRFLDNEISPGTSEPASQSRGAAMFTMPLSDPGHPRNVGGLVSNSVFSGNIGIPIWDNQPSSGLVNQMRYNGNQFYSTSFGTLVYVHNQLAPVGASAQELSFLPGKSDGGNTRLTSAPRVGAVLAAPPFLGTGSSASPGRSFLAYAWSGRAATLGGQSLSNKAGLLEATAAGDYALAVEGSAVGSARVAASACTSGPALCLNGDRFVAEVAWKDFQGKTGSGQAVSLTSDTGYFWFFNSSNVELVVKVLDGRPLNGSFWVFYGSLSNVEYTLKITDTVTGRVRSYRNPSGRLASAGDTSAFPVGKSSTLAPAEPEPLRLDTMPVTASNCVPGPTDLCLNGGRFRVSLDWKAQGTQGAGQAVPLTSDTGYFWFFSPTNVEVAIKVLDGRALNGHFWVFYGALSNVEYTITVTDTETGRSVTYKNPAGQFGSRADTSALPD
jgi:hypothetical protein